MTSSSVSKSDIVLEEDNFGYLINQSTDRMSHVKRFTWKCSTNNITVQVITYGATITSIKCPDKNGVIQDVVMGFDDMKGYLNPNNPYFGSTVGRVANRIGNGTFKIGSDNFKVSTNIGKHTLHGGYTGFDKVNWEYHTQGNKVVLSYYSKDGEEGFPGDLVVNVSFELTFNEFRVDFKAATTKPTYVNLTNHSYFNLGGHHSGAEDLYKHIVAINADRITAVSDEYIPTGELIRVANTVFDLQIPKVLGDVIDKVPNSDGFDHNFCVNKGKQQDISFIASAYHPASGRVLEIYGNQPGVQFYTSNFLPPNPQECTTTETVKLMGKNTSYYKHGAFCFETQNYPDAINHENFPDAVTEPGRPYDATVIYKFWLKDV